MPATVQDLEIERSSDFSQDLTVTDTTGKTYEAKLADRYWNRRTTAFTITIVDGTTIRLSLTAAQTADIQVPVNQRFDERRKWWGRYDVLETTTVGGAKARTHEGKIYLSRDVTRD